ncbi:MAG: hypothetical protein PHR47_01005 [Candidatus Pacebacteria bacterium]|nr:hypothetical protein [Candidatus Paceibacterota bacterium]
MPKSTRPKSNPNETIKERIIEMKKRRRSFELQIWERKHYRAKLN